MLQSVSVRSCGAPRTEGHTSLSSSAKTIIHVRLIFVTTCDIIRQQNYAADCPSNVRKERVTVYNNSEPCYCETTCATIACTDPRLQPAAQSAIQAHNHIWTDNTNFVGRMVHLRHTKYCIHPTKSHSSISSSGSSYFLVTNFRSSTRGESKHDKRNMTTYKMPTK